MNKFRSCYNKCVKLLFGYQRSYSVTANQLCCLSLTVRNTLSEFSYLCVQLFYLCFVLTFFCEKSCLITDGIVPLVTS